MQENYIDLNINEVEFDHENPRIKMALEKYGDKMNAERIAFALKSASPDEKSSTASFNKLKGSIRSYGGIAQPITVIKRDGKKICIDGNTRLAIYRELNQQGDSKKWDKIPTILLSNAEQIDIEKVRVSAHLVGAREWPAYEKARYLHTLYYQKFLEPAEMVALCGGNEKTIFSSIEAFNDMNKYYRDRLENDTDFRQDRFSSFDELQKGKVKDAIFEAGYSLEDFGDWVHNGQIHKNADVRQLPKILSDPESRKIFVEGSLDSATKARKNFEMREFQRREKIDGSTISQIQNAEIEDLALVLIEKLSTMTRSELSTFREELSSIDEHNTVIALQNLDTEIQAFLNELGI